MFLLSPITTKVTDNVQFSYSKKVISYKESTYIFTKGGNNMPDQPVQINLNKEQTIKFLSCFVGDAVRIANERKREQLKKLEDEKKVSGE